MWLLLPALKALPLRAHKLAPSGQVHHGRSDLRPECDEGPPAAQVQETGFSHCK